VSVWKNGEENEISVVPGLRTKVFAIQTPANSENFVYSYANVGAKKGVTDTRWLKSRKYLSQSNMVPAAVSKRGKCAQFSHTQEQKISNVLH